MKIPWDEIEFHPMSYCDRNGRLFSWQGGLYRALTQQGTTLSSRLFNDGIVQRLVDKNLLIETEVTDLSLAGYGLILKHRRLPYVSYPSEWSAEMFRDAALLIAELEIELAGYGLTLAEDADPWNLLFDGCRPIYIDFGSIRDSHQIDSRAYVSLMTYCIFPLRLTADGQGRLVRLLLKEGGPLLDELATLNQQPAILSWMKTNLRRTQSFAKRKVPGAIQHRISEAIGRLTSKIGTSASAAGSFSVAQVRQLKTQIEDFDVSSNIRDRETLPRSANWALEGGSVQELLVTLQPATVLIIGSNGDGCPELTAKFVQDVVVIDPDETVIDNQYRAAKKQNLNILPLVMDIRYPSPGCGICNKEQPPAIERLTSELVCAFGLVHRLVYGRRLTFDQIAETLSAFASRWLIVEFISSKSAEISEWWRSDAFRAWYSLENFMESLCKRFTSVKVHKSYKDERFLLLCVK